MARSMASRRSTGLDEATWTSIFAFLTSYNALEISLFLVGPGRTTIPIVLLQRIAWNFDPTVAAMATVQVAISAVALLALTRVVGADRIFGTQR